MRRYVSTLAMALLSVIPLACAQSSIPEPVTPPPRAEQPRTEVQPASEAPPVDVVAPPPAYGNKVVLARSGTTESTTH